MSSEIRMRRCRAQGHVGGRVLPVTDFHRRSKGGKRSSRCRFCTARAIKESRAKRARIGTKREARTLLEAALSDLAAVRRTPKVRLTAADLEVFEVVLPDLTS